MLVLVSIIVLWFPKLFSQVVFYRAIAGDARYDQIPARQNRQQQQPLAYDLRQPDTDQYQRTGQNPYQAVHTGIEPPN
jgi:hypothetical protein